MKQEVYYDRRLKSKVSLPLYKAELVEALYQKKWGIFLREVFLKYPFFSFLYGKYLDSFLSRSLIRDFIKDYKIDMSRFQKKKYHSFNDFFTRKLKNPEVEMNTEPEVLISPVDGRLLVYPEIDKNISFTIKGKTFSLQNLTLNPEELESYIGGTLLIFRLTPLDYHRFHFIDAGIPTQSKKIRGHYYTVNPISFQYGINVFLENKREYSYLQTENWGNVFYCEVGAIGVAGIKQTYQPYQKVKRGEEKGFFYFGASTVILLLEKGKVKIDTDIVNASSAGLETQVVFGERIGAKI
jgi:phosphatidylserine decarboxylase